MKGIITEISETGFGNDMLTIDSHGTIINSVGFINGLGGPVVTEGDKVSFDVEFFPLTKSWRAVNIELLEAT